MSENMYLVTTGSYSDYTVIAVAASEAEAQEYANAYTEAQSSMYRDPADVEPIEVYRTGMPLPRQVTVWNADPEREWSFTTVHTGGSLEPHVTNIKGAPRNPMAHGYPTREAARLAVDVAVLENELNDGTGV